MSITSAHLGTDVERIPFKLAVAMGYFKHVEIFRKFGMNPDVDAGIEYVWPPGTEMVYNTGAFVASLTSDNVGDDVAGVGALTVLVQGLDIDYNRVEELVTMTGAVAATTTQTFLRIYRMYNVSVGSAGVNQGNISATLDGNLSGYIEAAEGQTHMSQYTIPAGHLLEIDHILFNAGRQANADLATQFQFRLPGEGWRTFLDTFPYEGSFTLAEPIISIPEKSDMRVRIVTDATNANTSAEYSGYLIDLRADAY